MSFQKKIFLSCLLFFVQNIYSQQISGYWKGKVGNMFGIKVELKLVIKGDSIVGTSYYYTSKNSFFRYSVKGYFDPKTNAVIWWDDKLIESKKSKIGIFSSKENGLYVEANFNCPGGGKMMLDGNVQDVKRNKENNLKIHLDKTDNPIFNDEWNVVIDNWLVGGNNISLIDSIQNIAFNKPENETSKPLEETLIVKQEKKVIPEVVLELPVKKPTINNETIIDRPIIKGNKEIEFLDLSKPNKKDIAKIDTVENVNIKKEGSKIVEKEITFNQIEKPKKEPEKPKEIIKKFEERQKVILTEITIEADSIELNFYDNAEVDGDSISLFLNNQLLQEHIRLTDKPYKLKLTKEQLENNVELTMVAENLGAIPPNTSYMVAYVNGKKYSATLSSTEQTSAVIKFKKKE
jgi:hypothetical protein